MVTFDLDLTIFSKGLKLSLPSETGPRITVKECYLNPYIYLPSCIDLMSIIDLASKGPSTISLQTSEITKQLLKKCLNLGCARKFVRCHFTGTFSALELIV